MAKRSENHLQVKYFSQMVKNASKHTISSQKHIRQIAGKVLLFGLREV